MSTAPLLIVLPDGTPAWYVGGSGLAGHACCVTADGTRYTVQIPDALAATWHWHGSVLVRITGEALPTWDSPPPHGFRRARRIEDGYRVAHARDMAVIPLPRRVRKAA